MMQLIERYEGSLLGLACGDAVGTTVEFLPRASFPPVTDMTGGGPFGLSPGQWTDDTSMALCMAESLIQQKGFDPKGQMGRYLSWWKWGYLSSTGNCFDIGMSTQRALSRFQASGEAYSGSDNPMEAGNGSIMRLAPVVLYFFPDTEKVNEFAALSSRTTHAAAEAIDCCRLLAIAIGNALKGMPKEQILAGWQNYLVEEKVKAIAQGGYLDKSRDQIQGSGYSVESLEAALWCFAKTHSYQDAVLAAANLGDDADTTAAVVGQLAGAFYGVKAIPAEWLGKLHMADVIQTYAQQLYSAAISKEISASSAES